MDTPYLLKWHERQQKLDMEPSPPDKTHTEQETAPEGLWHHRRRRLRQARATAAAVISCLRAR